MNRTSAPSRAEASATAGPAPPGRTIRGPSRSSLRPCRAERGAGFKALGPGHRLPCPLPWPCLWCRMPSRPHAPRFAQGGAACCGASSESRDREARRAELLPVRAAVVHPRGPTSVRPRGVPRWRCAPYPSDRCRPRAPGSGAVPPDEPPSALRTSMGPGRRDTPTPHRPAAIERPVALTRRYPRPSRRRAWDPPEPPRLRREAGGRSITWCRMG